MLCSANICRSPVAEVLLDRYAKRLGAHDVHVHSAGRLDDGCAASADGVEVMAERGLDLSAHRSRRLTPEMLRVADLVVCMAREHVHHALVLAPDAAGGVFTLKGLVRRGEIAGARRPDEPMADWLDRLRAADGRADGADDDVRDPIGLGRRSYERMADELDDLASRLARLLWGEATMRRSA